MSSRWPAGRARWVACDEAGYTCAVRGGGEPSLLRRALLAGAAGTAAITVSTNVEMRLRGRPPSDAPIEAVERLAGRTLPARRLVGGAAHLLSGLALGLPRALLERAGLREPLATALFVPVAWAPDLVAVPALGAAAPPWRWGATELGVSLVHHLAYATGAGLALASDAPGPPSRLGRSRGQPDAGVLRRRSRR